MDRNNQKKYWQTAIKARGIDYLRCMYVNSDTNEQCKNYRLYFDDTGIKYFCNVHKNYYEKIIYRFYFLMCLI